MADARFIGADLSRPDTPEKAAGRAEYIHDMRRPGMLAGRIKFSEHAHARILSIDTRKAEALPGVKAVITAFNTPPVRYGFLGDNRVLKGDKVRQFRDEVAAVAAIDEETAAEAVELIEVEYEALPGVFDPHEALREGAPLVHEANPDGTPRHDNRLALTFAHESGDLERARRESAFIVEDVYRTPRIQQSCMGTAGCIAEFDGRGNLTMWAKTQIPFLAQRDFIRALEQIGLPGRNVRVIVPTLGGGFGTGLDTHGYEYLAILLAWKSGAPVKIVYTRHDEFAYLSPRQGAELRIAQGCDREGRLTFRDLHVLQDNGAYTSWGATYPSVMLLPATSLYRVPALRFSAELVYTNNTYCQAMRGYGNPEVTWPIECSLDDLAEQAGIDPFELRLRNCNQPGDVTPMGLRFGTCGLEECLHRAATALSWKEKRGQAARRSAGDRGSGIGSRESRVGQASTTKTPRHEARQEKEPSPPAPSPKPQASSPQPQAPSPSPPASRRSGVGMASLIHVGGGARIYRSDGSGCILKFDDFGQVTVFSGAVEMGQGLHSALSLMVAEYLGIRPEKVLITQTDTATCPWDVGTHASRGAYMAGNAARLACEKARARIFEAAEEIFPREAAAALRHWQQEHPQADAPKVDPQVLARRENFELQDGVIFPKHLPEALRDVPWLRLPLDRLLRAMHYRERGAMLTVEAFYEPNTTLPDWEKGHGDLSENYVFGVQGAEVEVDVETGEVRLVNMVCVHDVGRVLNLQTLRGQAYGALAQGIGYALYEEVQSREGRILNPGFTDYKIPTAAEMNVPIHLEFVETRDPSGPFGAKGVGEPGLVPTAAAIGNAIFDAVGVRIRDLPITPEKILAALHARRR